MDFDLLFDFPCEDCFVQRIFTVLLPNRVAWAICTIIWALSDELSTICCPSGWVSLSFGLIVTRLG
jgi:hypothetical protein